MMLIEIQGRLKIAKQFTLIMSEKLPQVQKTEVKSRHQLQ